MRLANVKGRLTTFVGGSPVDVEEASGGHFSSDPRAAYATWQDFAEWGRSIGAHGAGDVPAGDLGAPVPSPRQVFAIGVNYSDHAAEAGIAVPDAPVVFTKFPSCIVGPADPVSVVGETTDWEIELVVVIGKLAFKVAPDNAWDHVAGLTVGQDISERTLQGAGPVPQFSLGKSYPGFGPTGPYLVTLDELGDRDDLAMCCKLDGEVMQDARTSLMIFPVPRLISALSAVCRLFPGDLIFTGTSAGVGHGRKPPRFLRAGQTLTSTIEGLGTLTTNLV